MDPKLELHQYRVGKQGSAFSKHLLNIKYMPGTVLDPRHEAGNQGDAFFALMEFTVYWDTDFKQVISVSEMLQRRRESSGDPT